MYSLMLFEFIGVTLVFLGFRDHYLIKKISSNSVINITYWTMAYVMLILPLVIILVNKYVYKIKDLNTEYMNNINKKIVLDSEKVNKKVYILVIIATIICLISIIYVFYNIGYISFFKLFDRNFNFSEERISIGRNFKGNQYIKNIIMLGITPILSHIAYIYMRTTKQKKWIILFAILFIVNIFVKTYDFSKAPLIYYVCFFFIIEVLLGKTSSFKKIIPFVVSAIVLLVILYITVGNYKDNFISLSNGPLSRAVVTQAGTLFLHFDAFPNKSEFLKGHSFPPLTKILFGEGEYDIRSGRKVMEIYNSDAIENGTAGVMSTMFIGEAYANFGYLGIIISPIIVGFIVSTILCVYLKSQKTPLNMILYLECFIIFSTVLQAGFVDLFYNISFLIVLIVIFGIKVLTSDKFELEIKRIVDKIR